VAIWTQSDIDTLKTAIASGVLTVTYSGPPQRQIQYQSLAEMRSLLAAMIKDVEGDTGGSPRYRRARFSKGYR
jgi:hypothetical protein